MTEGIRLVSSENREAWHEVRSGGVTSTEVAKLIRGGARTRERILADKLNGSTFGGNQHTRRGNAREPILMDWVKRKFGIDPNSFVYSHAVNTKHLATPDGEGTVLEERGGGRAGAEVKSHDFGFVVPPDLVPADHYDQCQFAMYVNDVRRTLYVWEVMGEDGYPPLEPEYVWIERDDARIAELIETAERFIAWREAGAPKIDLDIADTLDDAISRHVSARKRKTAIEAEEKAAEADIRAFIAADEKASSTGLRASGSDGEVNFTVSSKRELDWPAWEAAHPVAAAAHRAIIDRLADFTEKLTARYGKAKPSTKLAITAHKLEKTK
jgi:hypothetical protein